MEESKSNLNLLIDFWWYVVRTRTTNPNTFCRLCSVRERCCKRHQRQSPRSACCCPSSSLPSWVPFLCFCLFLRADSHAARNPPPEPERHLLGGCPAGPPKAPRAHAQPEGTTHTTSCCWVGLGSTEIASILASTQSRPCSFTVVCRRRYRDCVLRW